MVASPLPPSPKLNFSFSSHKPLSLFKYPKITSQCFHNDGPSANTVDGNLGILKERIAEMRKKEKLESRHRTSGGHGWSYQSGYDSEHKRNSLLTESMEIIGFVGTALALVFAFGSISIFLVSFLVHMSELMKLP